MLILAALTPSAFACPFALGEEHVVEENLDDTSAPSTPEAPAVSMHRGVGPSCVMGNCSFTSCDDLGWIELRFSASSDDVSAEERVGYRLEVLGGTQPDGVSIDETRDPDLIDGGDAVITFVWIDEAIDEQEAFDFDLGITAVDEAGNESEQTTVNISDPGSVASAAGCAVAPGSGGVVGVLLALVGLLRRR